MILNIQQQLFNEVFSATNNIVSRAQQIINQPLVDSEENRLAALYDLGFINVPEVAAWKKNKDDILLNQAKLVFMDYYQTVYPFNKFIDLETVEEICKKYVLYLTPVKDLIDSIPAKNQKEIIAFKMLDTDIRPHADDYDFSKLLAQWSAQIKINIDHLKKNWKFNSPGKYLKVMAPEHKLDMGERIRIGHILIEDDPIVAVPVPFGYLIITCWGLEAGDSKIINPVFN